MKDKRGNNITLNSQVAIAVCKVPRYEEESYEGYLIIGQVLKVKEASCVVQLSEEWLNNNIYTCYDSNSIVKIK